MEFKVDVLTGDSIGSGTDANVWLVLYDDSSNKSPVFKLHKTWRNNFERGSCDDFHVSVPTESFGHVSAVEIWRDNAWFASNWFLDGVNVYKKSNNDRSTFPVHKWIKADHRYKLYEFGTSLPQYDKNKSEREEELRAKQALYELNVGGIFPQQIKNIPDDEKFSWDYKWDLVKKTFYMKVYAMYQNLFGSTWNNIEEIVSIYNESILPRPLGIERWRDDFYFGVQRVAGCSAGAIRLCRNIPHKFGVTEEMVLPFLEGNSLQEAINNKQIFIVDLDILENITHKKGFEVCAPIALFYENSENKLLPLAIQLQQDKNPNNPVFLPSDPEYTWIAAKMWFNNADAIWAQTCGHLLFTHLLMEGACVVTNRYLSPSHPIFRLLAPHFLYVISINARGLKLFIGENMWADTTFSLGFKGVQEIMNRGLKIWRMDLNGTLPADLQERGVLDDGVLKYYPYRDDTLLLYNAIKKYAEAYVHLYYDDVQALHNDYEIQNWAQSLVRPVSEDGLAYKGIPGDGQFTSQEELIAVVTSIIYICSVGHASVNMNMYDDYGFPPYFPSQLSGSAPTSKDALSMKDILGYLPDRKVTIDIMVVTKILSESTTNSLGNFEVNYIFDPPAKKLVDVFREDLKRISTTINERNKERYPPYTYLLPENVPNSITI